jgi:hypothetical protein
MSVLSAARAKSRAQAFGADNVYGSLIDNPLGDTKDLQNKFERADILGDAQQDYYKTVGDAQVDFYKRSGAQGAALADSSNQAGLLGGVGGLFSDFATTSRDLGLFGLGKK